MKPTLSIIVPVYNAELYLRECLDSVLAQSFTDYELILVNDGSTDNSLAVCHEYAARCPDSIKVLTKNNGGAASARNVGLDNAVGSYIGFVDSDDVIDPEMFEELIDALTRNEVDIATSSIKTRNSCKPNLTLAKEEFLGTTHDLLKRTFLWKENTSVNTKVFRKELIGNTRFKEGLINEDFIFLCEIYLKPGKAFILPKALYAYRETPNSVTSGLRPRFFDLFTNLEYVATILPKEDKKLRRLFNQYALTIHILSGVKIVKGRFNKTYKEWLRKNRRHILRNAHKLILPGGLSLRWRAKALFAFLRL